MGRRIEMTAEEKEVLILECLAGRLRMREAARRAGVGHSTMHFWISRYRSEGRAALAEDGKQPSDLRFFLQPDESNALVGEAPRLDEPQGLRELRERGPQKKHAVRGRQIRHRERA